MRNEFNGIDVLSIDKVKSLTDVEILLGNLWGCMMTAEYLSQCSSRRPTMGPFKKRPFYHTYNLSTGEANRVVWDRVEIPESNYHPTIEEVTRNTTHVHLWTLEGLKNILFALGYNICVDGDIVTISMSAESPVIADVGHTADALFDLLTAIVATIPLDKGGKMVRGMCACLGDLSNINKGGIDYSKPLIVVY